MRTSAQLVAAQFVPAHVIREEVDLRWKLWRCEVPEIEIGNRERADELGAVQRQMHAGAERHVHFAPRRHLDVAASGVGQHGRGMPAPVLREEADVHRVDRDRQFAAAPHDDEECQNRQNCSRSHR